MFEENVASCALYSMAFILYISPCNQAVALISVASVLPYHLFMLAKKVNDARGICRNWRCASMSEFAFFFGFLNLESRLIKVGLPFIK
jgi:hypothetical protein